MCGIIAVVRRRSVRTPPSRSELLDLLQPVSGLRRHVGRPRWVAVTSTRSTACYGAPGAPCS
jgi:hypothetical protein